MFKVRHITAVIAAATLASSTVASAAGLATWHNVRHGGRNFAYWGHHGVHVGHWYPGTAGWYPGKFRGWYPGKYAGAGVYYGCRGCDYGYYGDYYHHHHNNDNLLWYGLGVATILLAEKPRPAVAAAPAPPPPPPPVRHIELSADALFAFDKATLMPRGMEKLDQLVDDLGEVFYDSIVVVGYTDPLGSDMYNQRLSERRAATVASYLTSHGVHASTIRSEGRGETELMVTPADCSGARGRTALIACYQPNRRVEVAVTRAVLR